MIISLDNIQLFETKYYFIENRLHKNLTKNFLNFLIDRIKTFGYYVKYTNEEIMEKNKMSLIEAKANILKALAHPTRLWMVEKLSEGERCVCKFTEEIDSDFSTISKHLSVLKQAGIVEDRKQGKQVFYRLKVPCILNFMNCIESIIKTRMEDQINLLKHSFKRDSL